MDAQDEQDFHDFVVGQWHALLRTAYLLTGDRGEAEDLVQSALVRVHRNWQRIERRDAPAVYARRVLVNLNASIWRRRRLREQPTEQLPELPDADATEAHALRDELRRACLRLPPRQRAVLVLRYFEDLTEADTAATLGISVGAVKSQTSRGLDRLRVILAGDRALDAALTADLGDAETPTTTNGSPA
jgi:RNA polymerase sigma-70 factor (sigma-E family)